MQNSSHPRGFTIVELMMVLAIIGTLAALIVPNFSRYQGRARQKEAQIFLSAIFTSETAFRGEYGSYTGCLAEAGFRPEGSLTSNVGSSRHYTVGFTAAEASSSKCGANLNEPCYKNFNSPYSVTLCNGPGQTPVSDVLFNDILATSSSSFAASRVFGQMPKADLISAKLDTQGAAGALATTAVQTSGLSGNVFRAAAIGNIANSNLLDRWTIDEVKALVNTFNGI